jgi:TATA-binding protein-associated factor Taf7
VRYKPEGHWFDSPWCDNDDDDGDDDEDDGGGDDDDDDDDNNNNNNNNRPGNHEIKELQKTAILGIAHILRKVLT